MNLFGRRHARWSVRTRPFICNIFPLVLNSIWNAVVKINNIAIILKLFKNLEIGILDDNTITNTKGSTLEREATYSCLLYAGVEIAVASTKTYTLSRRT